MCMHGQRPTPCWLSAAAALACFWGCVVARTEVCNGDEGADETALLQLSARHSGLEASVEVPCDRDIPEWNLRFQEQIPHVVAALNKVFPKKWYVEGGMMLSTLRYGFPACRLSSGKYDMVDDDFDVTVFHREADHDRLVQEFARELPKSYRHHFRRSWGTEQFGMPKSHIHLLSVYEDDDGTLRPDPLEGSWFPSPVITNMSLRDMVFPLKAGRLAGVEVMVPNHYLFHTSQYSRFEYAPGADDWKTMWKNPNGPSGCGKNCSWTDDDEKAIHAKIRQLDSDGFASFYGLLPGNRDDKRCKSELELIKAYRARLPGYRARWR